MEFNKFRLSTARSGLIVFFTLTVPWLCGFTAIPPDTPTTIDISATDVNRIICRGANDAQLVTSGEKNLQHEKVGNDLYIKLPVFVKDDKRIYANEKVEMYILCGGQTYSIFGIPKVLPSVTIELKGVHGGKKAFKGLSFEEKLAKVIRYADTGNYPDTFTVEEVNKKPQFVFEGLELIEIRRITIDSNEGIILNEFHVKAVDNDVEVKETDFLPLTTDMPLAIALETTRIVKGKVARLFVISQTQEVQK